MSLVESTHVEHTSLFLLSDWHIFISPDEVRIGTEYIDNYAACPTNLLPKTEEIILLMRFLS